MRKIETRAITGGTINYDVSTPSVNTIEFWIKLKSDFNKTMKLFYNGTLSEIMLDARGSIGVRHAVNNYGNPGSIVYGNILLEKDKSNHIAITIGNSGCRIYINGKLSLSTTSISSYSRSFKMISFTEKDGVILEFPKFWSRELSKTEILESYKKKRDLISNIDGLIMYDLFADTGSINEVSNIPTTSSNITYHSKQTILYITKSLILHEGEHKSFNETIPAQFIDLLPVMKQPTQDGITVSVSSVYDGSNPLHYLQMFNKTNIDRNDCWASANNTRTGSVQIEFPIEKTVYKYSITSRNDTQYDTATASSPSTWTFEGSNDNTNWDILDSRQNITWVNNQTKEFSLSKPMKYKSFRLNILAISGNVVNTIYISIGKYTLYGWTDEIDRHWSTVSSTLPNATQFLSDGMDNISPLLNRTLTELEPITMEQKNTILEKNEIGKIFSKTIDLKKYFDIRSIRTEVK